MLLKNSQYICAKRGERRVKPAYVRLMPFRLTTGGQEGLEAGPARFTKASKKRKFEGMNVQGWEITKPFLAARYWTSHFCSETFLLARLVIFRLLAVVTTTTPSATATALDPTVAFATMFAVACYT